MVSNMDNKKMNRTAAFLSALVMVLSAVAAAPLYGATGGRAPGDATIKGIVTDQNTGLPLAGVNVHLSSANVSADTLTDPSGNYQFIVAPDTYDLQFSMTGYQTATAQVTGVADDTAILDHAMARSCPRLQAL